jgi:hypothetical protein
LNDTFLPFRLGGFAFGGGEGLCGKCVRVGVFRSFATITVAVTVTVFTGSFGLHKQAILTSKMGVSYYNKVTSKA